MIIVHAGMHKTGSSSIQDSLFALNGTHLDYLSITTPNHSGLFSALFRDSPETAGGFARQGLTNKNMQALRSEWSDRMDCFLQSHLSKTPDRPAIFSAEFISSAPDYVVQRIAEYLHGYDTNIRAIAYVRPPSSFISSAFQQRLKPGFRSRNLDLKSLYVWPKYRHRFEKLDQAFGRENVTLKLFQRDHMEQGDVVLDFAKEIGIGMTADQVMRSNESLSLEAVALLYTQIFFSNSKPGKDLASFRSQKAFVNRMMDLGSRRFVLGKAIIDPLIEANREDLDWMEARLGMSIEDSPIEDAYTITSEEGLLAAAVDALPLLEQERPEIITSETPTDVIARSVDLFQEAMRLIEPRQGPAVRNNAAAPSR